MKRGQPQRLEKETQRRLIEAGMLLFGLHGLEATSTRALAMEAGVNLAAIPYHFGGKKGLYLAVLEHSSRSNWLRSVPVSIAYWPLAPSVRPGARSWSGTCGK